MDALQSGVFFHGGLLRAAQHVVVLGAIIGAIPGCALHRGQSIAELPTKHTVRTPRLVVHSDLALSQSPGLLRELAELRVDILSTLALPEPKRPVVLYLFEDEARYTSFMKQNYPDLPTRRAFFIGSPTGLAVYAFHGDHLAVDLRHEYTHGVLHASLRSVPLWLDEGLAEYFETESVGERINDEHLGRLRAAIEGGWKPDLPRLEELTDVSQMKALDYHEAWAWVYTWLQGDENRRQDLIAYVHRLKEPKPPGKLAPSLEKSEASGERVLAQISTMGLPHHHDNPTIKAVAEEPAGFETLDAIPASSSTTESTAPPATESNEPRPFPKAAAENTPPEKEPAADSGEK